MKAALAPRWTWPKTVPGGVFILSAIFAEPKIKNAMAFIDG
jgi:hypothetical protein